MSAILWQNGKMKGKHFIFQLSVALLTTAYLSFLIPREITANADGKAQYSYEEGKAECVMELHSRRVLYQKSGDVRLPMASTTKILTCATVLEKCQDLNEKIVIPENATGIEGSSVYLKKDDVYTAEELLYGLMLRSGNDCATALALKYGGTIPDFTAKMNVLAQKAGALNSRFENPHGLACVNHYTTAYDLSLISCYAMHNTKFREIVATEYYLPRHWKNKNKMLHLYPNSVGIKTGFTKAAGRCLVSAATKEGMTLICTLLNCPTTYERTMKLLDDAFSAYHLEQLLSKERVFTLMIGGKEIKATANQDYFYPLLKEELDLVEIQTSVIEKEKNLKKTGGIIGNFKIYLAKQLLFSGNLYKL